MDIAYEHMDDNALIGLQNALEKIPTADVVEVVRCKDCKWYTIYEVKNDGAMDKRYKPSFCDLYRKHRKETYFCADGERRTG